MTEKKKANGGRLVPKPENIVLHAAEESEPATRPVTKTWTSANPNPNAVPPGLGDWLATELPDGQVQVGADPAALPDPEDEVYLRQEGFLMPDVELPDMPAESYDEDAIELEVPPSTQDGVREDMAAYVAQLVNSDRQALYGPPEQSLSIVAGMWNAYLNANLTANDVAAMMVMLKLSRIRVAPFQPEHWIDAMGYALIGGSIAVDMTRTDDDPEHPDDRS